MDRDAGADDDADTVDDTGADIVRLFANAGGVNGTWIFIWAVSFASAN
jgi:hypothetical protein